VQLDCIPLFSFVPYISRIISENNPDNMVRVGRERKKEHAIVAACLWLPSIWLASNYLSRAY